MAEAGRARKVLLFYWFLMDNKLIVDNHFLAATFDLISSAKRSVDISSYKFQPPSDKKNKKINILFNLIALKAKGGITVRVLLNKEQPLRGVSRVNFVAARYLNAAGVLVKRLKDFRICHAKIILVDNIRYYIGSHNFSEHAFRSNFETGVCGSDVGLARELSFIYDRLWTSGKDFF